MMYMTNISKGRRLIVLHELLIGYICSYTYVILLTYDTSAADEFEVRKNESADEFQIGKNESADKFEKCRKSLLNKILIMNK